MNRNASRRRTRRPAPPAPLLELQPGEVWHPSMLLTHVAGTVAYRGPQA